VLQYSRGILLAVEQNGMRAPVVGIPGGHLTLEEEYRRIGYGELLDVIYGSHGNELCRFYAD
jgi:hypothetical protein